jgi:hypothetical protein
MELAEAKKLLSALGNLHAEPGPSGSAAQPRSRLRRRVQHCGRRSCCAGCCGVACVGASKRGLRQCSRAAASGGEGGERSRAGAACEGAREVPAAPGVPRAPHRLFSAAKGRYNSGHGRTYRCMESAAGPYPATAAVLIAHPCCGHGTCTHSHHAKPHEQRTHRRSVLCRAFIGPILLGPMSDFLERLRPRGPRNSVRRIGYAVRPLPH